jgi:hypothetical protein
MLGSPTSASQPGGAPSGSATSVDEGLKTTGENPPCQVSRGSPFLAWLCGRQFLSLDEHVAALFLVLRGCMQTWSAPECHGLSPGSFRSSSPNDVDHATAYTSRPLSVRCPSERSGRPITRAQPLGPRRDRTSSSRAPDSKRTGRSTSLATSSTWTCRPSPPERHSPSRDSDQRSARPASADRDATRLPLTRTAASPADKIQLGRTWSVPSPADSNRMRWLPDSARTGVPLLDAAISARRH